MAEARERFQPGDTLKVTHTLDRHAVAVGDTVKVESVQGSVVTFIAPDGTRRNWVDRCFQVAREGSRDA